MLMIHKNIIKYEASTKEDKITYYCVLEKENVSVCFTVSL